MSILPRISRTERMQGLTDIPFLAVTVGNDSLLPIASFARRDGGECNYVQLGQEINDDNFYVTSLDDKTSRYDLIEALREQISDPQNRSRKDPQHTDTIQRFIDSQSEAQKSSLAQAYEHQLVRKSMQRFKHSKTISLMTIGEDQFETSAIYNTSPLIPPTVLNDGRLVSLVLAKPVDHSDKRVSERISLFAITRNRVATELASMSTQFLQFELSKEIDLSPDKRERIIQDLLFQIIARPPIKDIKVSEDIIIFDEYLEYISDESKQIAKYLLDEEMLSESEMYYGRLESTEIKPQIRLQLETFFAYPIPYRSPFPYSEPLKIALNRLGQQQKQDKELLYRLQADKIFAKYIGEDRRCDQVLLHFVGKLALVGKELEAVFHDVQIGKTKADAKIVASALLNNGMFELSITGRPESMPDEPLKPLLNVILNPLLPRLGQEKSYDAFSEKRVDELIGIIYRIISENSTKPKSTSKISSIVGSRLWSRTDSKS